MKVNLTHVNNEIIWKGPWCYLGSNYMDMICLKQTIDGKNFTLTKLINDEGNNQKSHILQWIKCQRESNNDSLLWWMSQLAGKNNAASQFFLYLVQIAALRRWISENWKENPSLLVVCDDIFFMLAIRDNLRDEYQHLSRHTSPEPNWLVPWKW